MFAHALRSYSPGGTVSVLVCKTPSDPKYGAFKQIKPRVFQLLHQFVLVFQLSLCVFFKNITLYIQQVHNTIYMCILYSCIDTNT